MSYKMKGFSGFKSPLKQDYKILTTDKELEDARKRMNRSTDAVEEIKNIGKGVGIKKGEEYMATGADEAMIVINRQLKREALKKESKNIGKSIKKGS
tara:strand:- start:64 stop:354 length:291 start_codon:yes stop_codon:yes gene_type:complete